MGLRRRARELAMQMLYQAEMGGQSPEDLLRSFLPRQPAEDESKEFAAELFTGAHTFAADLDPLLEKYLAHWTVPRLASVDRALLRLALFELFHRPDIPAAVTINEAVDLAKRYSTDESGKFVNGVLDRIRQDESVDATKESPTRARKAPDSAPS